MLLRTSLLDRREVSPALQAWRGSPAGSPATLERLDRYNASPDPAKHSDRLFQRYRRNQGHPRESQNARRADGSNDATVVEPQASDRKCRRRRLKRNAVRDRRYFSGVGTSTSRNRTRSNIGRSSAFPSCPFRALPRGSLPLGPGQRHAERESHLAATVTHCKGRCNTPSEYPICRRTGLALSSRRIASSHFHSCPPRGRLSGACLG